MSSPLEFTDDYYPEPLDTGAFCECGHWVSEEDLRWIRTYTGDDVYCPECLEESGVLPEEARS